MNSSSCVEYFRKQAKSLSRTAGLGEAGALRRFERYLTNSDNRSLTKGKYIIAREYGFPTWEKLIQADDIERQLAIAMFRERLLHYGGIAIGLYDGLRRMTNDERARVLQDERQLLREHVQDVRITLEWLKGNLRPVKTLRRPVGAYRLKHVAEEDIGYITKGVFIAAGFIGRYPFHFERDAFGVSLSDLRAIEDRQMRANKSR